MKNILKHLLALYTFLLMFLDFGAIVNGEYSWEIILSIIILSLNVISNLFIYFYLLRGNNESKN